MVKDSRQRPCIWAKIYDNGKEKSVLVPIRYLEEFNIIGSKRKDGKFNQYEFDKWMRTVDQRYPVGTFMERWSLMALFLMLVLVVGQIAVAGAYIGRKTELAKQRQKAAYTKPVPTAEQKREKDQQQKEKDRAALAQKELQAHQKDSAQKAFFKTYKKNYYCKYDKVFDGEVCQCKKSPRKPTQSGVYMYFVVLEEGKKKTDILLRYRIQYAGRHMLSIDNYRFAVDKQSYTYHSTGKPAERGGDVLLWENKDDLMDAGIVEIFDAMRKAKSTTIRYNGIKYYDEHKVTKQEQADLNTMMDLYDLFRR